MKIFSSKKRVAAIGVVTAATLVGGGVAFAYFTASGTGSGTATTGSSTAWDVDVVDSNALNLTPTAVDGIPVQVVQYTIQNDSSGQQFLDKAVISVASVSPGTSPVALAGPFDCTAMDFGIGGEDAGDSHTQTIELNQPTTATYNGTVELRLVDNDENQDKCQGATVTLQVVAS